jgi:hypothetical protein
LRPKKNLPRHGVLHSGYGITTGVCRASAYDSAFGHSLGITAALFGIRACSTDLPTEWDVQIWVFIRLGPWLEGYDKTSFRRQRAFGFVLVWSQSLDTFVQQEPKEKRKTEIEGDGYYDHEVTHCLYIVMKARLNIALLCVNEKTLVHITIYARILDPPAVVRFASPRLRSLLPGGASCMMTYAFS